MLDMPIEIVGGSTFGRYPIISSSKTVNMYISDNWLVSYPGFRKVIDIDDSKEGRAVFHSIRGNFVIFVVGANVYKITGVSGSENLGYEFIGKLDTSHGEVFIDENLASQIVIVDGLKYYTYFYGAEITEFKGHSLPDTNQFPGYISYINGYFLIAKTPTSDNAQEWLVYETTLPASKTELQQLAVGGAFNLETKPDKALAVIRLPGRGNHVMVFGSSVTELWSQVGDLQNFARNSSFNIDYGCVSVSTIAASDGRVCWLAANESSAPTIMVSDGAQATPISTDGINDQLQKVRYPSKSTAYFYRQDGHLFYVLTFYDDADNFTVAYDFTSRQFSHLTDDATDCHPARQVVYYNETTYFASLFEGSVFELSSDIPYVSYNADGSDKRDLPRIRVCNTVRLPDNRPFRVGQFTFLMEQGVNSFFLNEEDLTICSFVVAENGDFVITEDGDFVAVDGEPCVANESRPSVDLTVSRNGGMTYSNAWRKYLNSQGIYRNRVEYFRLGYANEFTIQLRFYGLQRFVCNNGLLRVF